MVSIQSDDCVDTLHMTDEQWRRITKKLHFPWVFAVTWAKEAKPMKKG